MEHICAKCYSRGAVGRDCPDGTPHAMRPCVWLVVVEWPKTGGDPDVRGAFTTEEAATLCRNMTCAEIKEQGDRPWWDYSLSDEDAETVGHEPNWDFDIHVVPVPLVED